jgi:hypothetical protein
VLSVMSVAALAAVRSPEPVQEPPAAARLDAAAPVYVLYAAAFLVVTLLSGAWLRAAFLWPDVLGSFSFANALHAHSHVAFFGWTSMALFALLTRSAAGVHRPGWVRVHAHLVGLASAAAFVGFLRSGYAPHTIAISALHVVLWFWFAVGAWAGLRRLPVMERRFYQAAVAFLVLSGVGAKMPGIVMARGALDPWLNQLAVQSFLTPFASGWLVLGAMGAVYGRIERVGMHRWVLGLTVTGVVPSTFLHTIAAPPYAAMHHIGRAGTLLLGVAAVLFAWDVLRSRTTSPVFRLVGIAVLGAGAAQLIAALALDTAVINNRSLTIAYLHLVLLGVVTPALVATALPRSLSRRVVAFFGGGLAVMLVSLGMLGWVPALGWSAQLGISPGVWYPLAFTGAAVAAAALLPALLCPLWRSAVRWVAEGSGPTNPGSSVAAAGDGWGSVRFPRDDRGS